MRLHLLGMPHSQFTKDYATCAFTQKGRKFCRMMHGHHDVFLYSGGECDVPVKEHIQLDDPTIHFPGGFDPVLTPMSWEPDAPYWRDFIEHARVELYDRVEPGDLVLASVSSCTLAAEGVRDRALCIEHQVGYEGVWADYAIFESYAWMHHVYGMKNMWARAMDDVVPGIIDARDFEPGADQGYLLFMGRMVASKGPHVASQIAQRLDLPIIFAGPGASTPAYAHEIVCDDGTKLEGEYEGTVDFKRRRELMAGASCLLVPTLYIEPFGGVSAEALASGVPVVASDWGVFTETITEDVGRRFRTLQEGCDAVEAAIPLRGGALRSIALSRWGFDAIRPRYERAFERFNSLWGMGWAS
jgi:glycosyltransferase involved in cell wall biosynthesis